jgi:N-acetylglucosaminyldiphosphoundecaprenol N-acetyl-beta-D-mannosaminyltransferase
MTESTPALNSDAAAMAAEPRPFPRRNVLKAAVNIASPGQILEHLSACADARRGCSVAGVSAPYATAMSGDAALRDAFLGIDLLVPDGKGFVWGARMLHVDCGERVAIPDLCESLLARGSERGWKVFIYGASSEVNAAACENVRRRFPGLAAVEGCHGYEQGRADEDALIERLARGRFNLLIVARPSPDKELFLARCCRQAGVVGLAAGGYADILAGKIKRAPALVQAMGMEWLWRVVQEPRRLWRRIGVANVRFAAAVALKRLVTPAPRPWWGSRAIHVLALVLVLCAAYYKSLNAPYTFDDPEYIMKNPAIRSFEGLSQISVMAHRKLWWLSNAICYRASELYGNHQVELPDVRVFRLWNIACHFIAALALMGLIRSCMRGCSRLAPGKEGAGTAWDLAAFGAAAIFAGHPLATESVTYICGRDNGQGGMFYLLGLYCAALAFERMSSSGGVANPAARPRWPGWVWPLAASMACGACAVLTKESHLTFPVAAGLVYVCFFRGSGRRTVSLGLLLGALLSVCALGWGAKNRLDGGLGVAAQLILLFTLAGAWLGSARPGEKPAAWRAFLRRRVHAGWAALVSIGGLAAASVIAFPYAYQRTFAALTGFQNSSYVRSLLTQAHAVPRMLLRAVFPHGLNIDHDFPTITSFDDPRAQWGAAIILGLLVFGLIGLYRRSLGGFAVLLGLLSILPSNSVIERGDVVSERNFYLAAACGAMLLAWLAAVIAEMLSRRLLPTGKTSPTARLREAGLWTGVAVCCAAGPFSAFTVLRNNEWNDPLLLWTAAKEQSPDKLRVLHNYGVACVMKNRLDEAYTAFNSAIEIGEYKALNNLFRPDEAVEVKCFHISYAYRAQTQLKRLQKNPDAATPQAINAVLEQLRKGVERTAYDPDLAFVHAQFLQNLSRMHEAVPVLERAISLHSWADHLFLPMGMAQLDIGDYQKAEHFLERAAKMRLHNAVGVSVALPGETRSEILAYLGLTRLFQKKRAEAVDAFRQSAQAGSQGLLSLLSLTPKTRNTELPKAEFDPPDTLLTALSQTRRDLLKCARQGIDELLAADPAKSQTVVQKIRDAVNYELQRRATAQKKRADFGFTDDRESGYDPEPAAKP